MKLNFVSDLHLEFGPISFTEKGDVLILAGDITTENDTSWIKTVSKNFKDVIYVLGNHECYYQSLGSAYKIAKKHLPKNVHLLQNESITIDGITFHGTTLWSDFEKGNPMSYMICKEKINDFSEIESFAPEVAHEEHKRAVAFLRENVKEDDIVVTHHAPSYESYSVNLRGDKLNGAYASDLTELILDTNPYLWFHGHLHNSSDYMVGNTRVLCNPRGYVGLKPPVTNPVFDQNAIVDLAN